MQAEKQILKFIRDTFRESGAEGVVVGLSGGVDSSLVAALCARALGKDKVLGLIMPERGTTSEKNVRDAREVANLLGIGYYEMDFAEVYKAFGKLIPVFDSKALVPSGNLMARIRMCLLYYFANKLKFLVAGTGDRSEILMRYFTKYGDGGVDFLPIGDLYKSKVRELALEMGIPRDIVDKPSSPGLWVGQTAKQELGLDYDKLDAILSRLYDEGKTPAKVAKEVNVNLNKVLEIIERSKKGAHKTAMPPIARIRGRVKL